MNAGRKTSDIFSGVAVVLVRSDSGVSERRSKRRGLLAGDEDLHQSRKTVGSTTDRGDELGMLSQW